MPRGFPRATPPDPRPPLPTGELHGAGIPRIPDDGDPVQIPARGVRHMDHRFGPAGIVIVPVTSNPNRS